MKVRSMWTAAAPLVLALALFSMAVPGSAHAQDPGPQAVAVCPAPEALTGVAVCVDRGEGAVYYEGDPIAVCVTVNLPVIAIAPPPPAPLVRVTGSVDDGAPRVLLEDHFWSGERCITSTITPPLGPETIRAEVNGPATYVRDETRYTSRPRTQPSASFPTLTLSYTDAQGPGLARMTPQDSNPASGGTAIAMTLTQNGIDYAGCGFVRPGELGGYVLDVTITGAYGDSYHLSGTLTHDQDRVRWRGQGRWWATCDRSVTGAWSMAGGPFAERTPRSQLSATVQLEPMTEAAVRGVVTLVTLPEGETRFELRLEGLLPGQAYAVQLHAGSVALPSASFTQVATVHADAFGRAAACGLVQFRGTEDVALLEIADGNHVLTVVGFGQTVAEGAIPALQPLG